MSNYIFNNADERPTSQRFSSLETLYDPWTIRHLEATGIGTSWQCWEVGGGGGSIAAWLAERSGSTGHVLVTDIDPRFLAVLATLDQSPIEIQHHDIGVDALPEQTFDLIHARLVLIHVPTREQALQRMITALKPGGWLVIEDFDHTFLDFSYPTMDATTATFYQKMQTTLGQLMEARGGDPTWGRSLYRRLRTHGLVNVSMEGYVAVREGGSPGARLVGAAVEQIREEAINAGIITNEEVTQMLALLDDPDFAFGAPILFTAWGRRPV